MCPKPGWGRLMALSINWWSSNWRPPRSVLRRIMSGKVPSMCWLMNSKMVLFEKKRWKTAQGCLEVKPKSEGRSADSLFASPRGLVAQRFRPFLYCLVCSAVVEQGP
jgi:hypothetical protein